MIFSLPLDTGWSFREPRAGKWLEAKVPGCIHTDLRRHGLIPDPFWGANEKEVQWIEDTDWTYRCAFEASPDLFAHEQIDLVAECLDTVAILRLNGTEIARTANMFMGYRFPVKNWLKEGSNLLEIHFENPMGYIRARQSPSDYREWNDPVGGCQHIRKEQCSFGWDWAARLATSGIAGKIGLEAWSVNRIERVRVGQDHSAGLVRLGLDPELQRPDASARFKTTLRFEDKIMAQTEALTLDIAEPKLWWPNTLGDQPLYSLEVALLDADGAVRDVWKKQIGLRTIQLDCHPDEFGESFQFLVNGKPIFAKGAAWIPAHSFITEATPELYEDLIESSVRANLNMLRVWGGGIYEKEVFYDLCDQKGLLVWQDFMFACTLYPGTEEFKELVRAEAEFQVKRLAHRACLALWCGNNEMEGMVPAMNAIPERRAAYEAVFYGILPEIVKRLDGVTAYWPCSPHNPEGLEKGDRNERAGDCHFWDVWHGRKPVRTYEAHQFRFYSEFGMQSYSSPEVAATFCPPEEFNVFGPAMENHQKNSAGNLIIFDYLSQRLRFPKDYASLAYLSQINQAYTLKFGVEHFRRSMPRTMGALYWQLNDCWPVFSWSSIEFDGTWKALHWAARRFFAPALVSAHIPGEEGLGIGNTVINKVDEVRLYTVYDDPKPGTGNLGWTLFHLNGEILDEGSREVSLNYGESKHWHTLSARAAIHKHGVRNLILRIYLDKDGKRISEDMIFLTAPKYIEFKRDPIQATLAESQGGWRLTLCSTTFHPQTVWQFRGFKAVGDANYIDLYPGEARTIHIEPIPGASLQDLKAALSVRSLVDSY